MGDRPARLDRRTFEGSIPRHLPVVFRFLRHLGAGPTEAEDLMQETFMRACRFLDSYDPQRSLAGWLLGIARNVLYKARNQAQRERNLARDLPREDTPRPGVEETAVRNLVAGEILQGLSEEGRLLVEMRVFQDLSFAEIGELLGEAEGTVRVRFHRVLMKLQDRHAGRGQEGQE